MKKYCLFLLAALLLSTCLTGCLRRELPIYQAPTADSTEITSEAPSETVSNKVADILCERFQNDDGSYTAYIVVTALNENGDTVWEYRSADCIQTELTTVEMFAEAEDTVYINEQGIPTSSGQYDGYITALDRNTGEIKWRNSDFYGGCICYCFDDEGTMYCCGYYGPDCIAITPSGETKWIVETVDPTVWWPFELEYEGGLIYIYYDGDETGYGASQYRCLTQDGEQFIGGF